ncbi:MAG: sugar ABC transporter permease [Eubacteriales bacterium]|nr:sugar ABC transporter permease [Eubacteriales bacterium]MDD3882052.1 sugar ABC transporter permease [Eubacteriales bacterium]MDD4512499.1 sugar ABC transporter permease [Eubacteriales bacterium]
MAQQTVTSPRKIPVRKIKNRRPVVASCLFMGLGQLLYQKQFIKGIFYALIELMVIINANTFLQKITGLITLGDPKPELPVKDRDHSIFMMVEGIIFLILFVVFLCLYVTNILDAHRTQKRFERVGHYPTQRVVASSLADSSFAFIGLSPVIVLLSFFVIIPLMFSAMLAFTNYASPDHIPPANTVDWVGFGTFRDVFEKSEWATGFTRTAVWTLVWATLATVTCYVGGMLMAMAMLDKRVKAPKLFRTIYILPYAVPSMLSLMVWRNLLNGQFGPINKILIQWGWIDAPLPWLTQVDLARFSCVLVNLWLGFPYFMMLITGLMTSIPRDLYEAADIDGANKRVKFFRITLPLVLYQTIPLFIMNFSFNLNNFGAVYFLTQGNPSDFTTTQSGAGTTDILMSWMYKLTYDQRVYNKAAVVSILVFLVIAPFAIYNFSRTKAFKDGEL